MVVGGGYRRHVPVDDDSTSSSTTNQTSSAGGGSEQQLLLGDVVLDGWVNGIVRIHCKDSADEDYNEDDVRYGCANVGEKKWWGPFLEDLR